MSGREGCFENVTRVLICADVGAEKEVLEARELAWLHGNLETGAVFPDMPKFNDDFADQIDRDGPEIVRDTILQGLAAIGEPAARAIGELGPDCMTDSVLAERFLTFANGQGVTLRYCPQVRAFMVFKSRWVQDSGETEISAIYSEFRKQELLTAAEMQGRDGAKQRIASAVSLGNRKKHDNVLAMLQKLPGVPVSLTEFDADPYTLQDPKGIVDLRTGNRHAARPDDMCLRIAGATYYTEADCPNFKDTVLKACCGDTELADHFQRWAGYLAIGHNRAEQLPIWFGSGANYKSTIRECLRAALGQYAAVCLPSILLARDTAAPTNDLARLAGVRAVFCSETDENARLADGFIKYITSNETITARFMHQEFFEFTPQFKILLATNHKPITRAVDEGLWRRLALVPFKATIPESDRMDNFREEVLMPELDGIFTWMVEGAGKYCQGGLKKPAVVVAATAEYRNESDLFRQWREDCWVAVTGGREKIPDLWESFKEWHRRELGAEPHGLTTRTLTSWLSKAGFERSRESSARGFEGLMLLRKEHKLALVG